ncbi:DUF4349 domain-containing protein [Kribbella deserti]|uniref:DUF4349 domain-containing protein n=1 Tax=Kribbella deserti TaxID=1926257 RepID=A0ABV6QWS7_9ACTN
MYLKRYPAAVAGLMLTAAVLLSGCSGSSGPMSDSGAADTASTRESDQSDRAADGSSNTGKPEAAPGKTGANQPTLTRSIVRTGFLTIESPDLTSARDKIATIVAGQRGLIASEQGGSGRDDKPASAELVLRVPSAAYDTTVRRLTAEIGAVKQIRQESADVTEQVVDVESRIATQRAALNRMRALLTKANTIGEIVSVESELTRREADLEALLAKQKALEGQTELATITVTLVRPGEAPPPKADDRGFLVGLGKGWNAFSSTVSAFATAAGALLPFAIALALIGVPVWFLIRRRQSKPAATLR